MYLNENWKRGVGGLAHITLVVQFLPEFGPSFLDGNIVAKLPESLARIVRFSIPTVQPGPTRIIEFHVLPANAPVQARWAHAQRAGPLPPNPPTAACNRLLARVRSRYIGNTPVQGHG